MENNICPYLGFIDDPLTRATYPDEANACHNIKQPALLAYNYQRRTCLQATHKECPGYVHGWKNRIPRSIRRREPIISPFLREGLAWLLLAIPVIVFLWVVFTGRLAFTAPDFFPSAGTTPTSLPFFTRTPTETLIPTEDFIVTILLTETMIPTTEPDTPDLTQPPPTPVVSVRVKTNCRLGPGLQYELIGALMVGEQAEVVGVSENGEYWVIKNPWRDGECWLWGRFASVEGDISGLPVRTPPAP